MKKKLFIVLTVMMLIGAMTACGNKGEVKDNENTATKNEDINTVFTYEYQELEDGTLNLYSYEKEGNGTVCEIPNEIDGKTVTSIEKLFCQDSEITKVVLPDTVKVIGKDAFSYTTALEEVVIPDSVETIGDYAFFQCEKITKLVFGNKVTYLGQEAIANCPNLHEVHMPFSVDNDEAIFNFSDNSEDFTVFGPEDSRIKTIAGDNGVNYSVE